ncbi:lysine-specific demethylase 6B isoform X1 [Nasonia vitripennis]|uniref:PDZ domain-containing protein n=1 Tax=Nasonia vitripennis TaxID=7425 RepID=A0A7M7G685_NASVI|nr:lysine-specific demethylase 6B isoform X1 [Nasonia vitripennis]
MDSNMSTAAYVHRAGGGGSTSGTMSSSPANGNTATTGGGGGGRMAVIGVTRNVKLRRRGAAGFGFSLRGGREYGAGFYVSDVVPGGEAHRNGLRVGDQILRVNGYPVEDAVHQEVALLAKNQQVLVLKIRSVGMIPVKDNPNDPVTWHMVQQQQQQLQYGDAVSNEIRIRVLVGEKGRLGCGVCKGLVPGLTVQGTREGGPARAAGLKAGDIILWCNGQSLTDLPFERAIEVMRNSAILDLIVNRPIVSSGSSSSGSSGSNNHVYDCPEQLWMRGSSGYDSESSSLVGPSPTPPPPPPMQMQMSASPQHRQIMMSQCNRNGRNCCPASGSGPSDWGHMEQSQEWTRKANNTTIIRINQQPSQTYGGPPQHQQHVRRGSGSMPRAPLMMRSLYDDASELDEEPLYDPVAPKDYECHDFDANPRDEIDRRAEYRREHGIREYEPTTVDDIFIKDGQADTGSAMGSQRQLDKKTVTTVEVHQPCPPAPPSMPPAMPYKWPAETKPMNAMGMQMGSTMSMGSTGSTETESSLESSCGGKDCGASTSSSLSTSSSCEQNHPAQAFASSIAAAAATKLPTPEPPRVATVQTSIKAPSGPPTGTGGAKPVPPPPPPPPIDLGTAITKELERRAKQRSMNNATTAETSGDKQQADARKPAVPQNQEQKVTHDKLMEEFKRAHQRMFSNAQQRNQDNPEQNEEKRAKPVTATSLKPAVSTPNLLTRTNNLKNVSKTNNDDRVEMQSIESFKIDPDVPPKPPSTYFTSINNKNVTTMTLKPKPKPKPNVTITSAAGPGKSVSKVAIRIGTYNEIDSKQPSRLGFLSQEATPTVNGKTGVASRLHNELAATLQRSNLRKKTEGENEIPNAITEESINILQENGIDNLATSLNNKVTIRVNTEPSSR